VYVCVRAHACEMRNYVCVQWQRCWLEW
jgi:hypothetical protein